MSMRFGSLFSGIGGFDLGFERAGMTCAWQCEIDAAARNVLRQHFCAPIIGDVRDVNQDTVLPVDLVCGGFPCQDVSVAGKRAGLAGERSSLWFEFYRVIAELKPQWVVVENVPGLLSSNGGRDFAVIVRGLVECGYGVAWRILDAQYFGVPQRRRRVFIVGSLGDGRAAQILFESEGVSRDSAQGQKARKGITGTLAPGAHPGGITGREIESGVLVFGGNNTTGPINVATACNAKGGTGRIDFESETFVFESRVARNGRGAPEMIAPPLKAQSGGTGKGDGSPLVFHGKSSHHQSMNPSEIAPALDASKELTVYSMRETGQGFWQESEQAGTLRAEGENRPSRPSNVVFRSGIRRLTPTECERLQGFPDGWTAGQSDAARYRQLGNAVAVPVIEWIGRRIVQAESTP